LRFSESLANKSAQTIMKHYRARNPDWPMLA
jgi:hypothetical protein